MGKFSIKPTSNGGYMFNLIANNHQVICTSQVYASITNAKAGAESVRTNCSAPIEDQTVEGYETVKHPKYEVYLDVGGKTRFRLKAANGEIIAEISGPARGILTAERTALNFLQRLSGIATTTHRYTAALAGSHTVLLDTRKTTPGYRNLEKYAVAVGGGTNHRIGLYDRIMIKDNHRELAAAEGDGAIARAVARARKAWPQLEIEVEADRLEEVREAADAGAEYILLDNMSDEMMAEAVKIVGGRSKLEASGGITLERLPRIAATGVDFVSSGALTHSVKAADISLDVEVVS